MQKPQLGPLIAELSGVPLLRERCPHFDGWLRRLLAWPGVAAAP